MFITRSCRSTIARSGAIYPMCSHTSPSKRGRRVGRCSPPAIGCALSRTARSRTTMRPVKSSTKPGSLTSRRKTAASIFAPSPSACSAICRPQFTGATCLPARAGDTPIRGPICCPMPSGKRHAQSSAARSATDSRQFGGGVGQNLSRGCATAAGQSRRSI